MNCVNCCFKSKSYTGFLGTPDPVTLGDIRSMKLLGAWIEGSYNVGNIPSSGKGEGEPYLQNILWQLSLWATVWPYKCFKEALKCSSDWTWSKAPCKLSGALNWTSVSLAPLQTCWSALLLQTFKSLSKFWTNGVLGPHCRVAPIGRLETQQPSCKNL